MDRTYYHYTVEEWRYRQPAGSEKSFSFWTSPRNHSPYPLNLTLVCTNPETTPATSLGSVYLVNNLEQYDIDDHHEGCVSVSGDYFKDLQTAMFSTISTGVNIYLEIGVREERIDKAEIFEFGFELIAE